MYFTSMRLLIPASATLMLMVAACSSSSQNNTPTADAGDADAEADVDASGPGGLIALRVDQARITSDEPLQLNLRVSNGAGAMPLELKPTLVQVYLSDGSTRAARAVASGRVWVDGADATASVLAGQSFQWRIEVATVTRSSGLVPTRVDLIADDGRTASAAVTIERCAGCGTVCTYLDRDVQNCGSCGAGADGNQPTMRCTSGALACTSSAIPSLCAQGAANKFACVNTQSSTQHCGQCGVPVPAGGSCVNGSPRCADGSVPQAGSCQAWREVNVGTIETLNGVWGSGANDVWMVGWNGTALHWNGAQWSATNSGTSRVLEGVWGSASNDVWAVGRGGTVVHWNGSAWSAPTSLSAIDLMSVWGSDASNVWTVVGNGNIFKWNGANWSQQVSPSTSGLNAVHGSSSQNVWAVGFNGAIVRWNGTSWASVNAGTTNHLYGVWASSENDVWISGEAGLLRHWNGTSWTLSTSGTTSDLYKFWGASPTELWVAGSGQLRRWNGTSWSSQSSDTSTHFGIWGSSTSNIWVVGTTGTALHYAP